MKFDLYNAKSYWSSRPIGELTIDNLEDLIDFIKETDEDLVIKKDCKRIIIYDDYLE